jgi:hypothetical protein
LPQRGEHSATPATGVEQRKIWAGRLNDISDVLTKGLVPPIAILDRAHDVVFLGFHPV